MHRTQIYLTDEQRERIARMADDRGVSKAEVIRRILDRSLGIGSDADERVEAVIATAGVMPDAPDWPEWQRRIRGRSADERLRDLEL
jgi:hypothetical protein